MKTRNKKILAFAGGKGGTGKSSFALAFADRYARRGNRTVIIDLDLGASNIHTMLGIHSPDTGLSRYLFDNKEKKDLSHFMISTAVPNLSLISSNSLSPGFANIEYQRKRKIIRAIRSLDCDVIILDIGAGTSYNSTDFFDMADYPVIVTTTEPTSIINAYEFLKSQLFRRFRSTLKESRGARLIYTEAVKSGLNTEEFIHALEKNGRTEAAESVRRVCDESGVYMLINRVTTPNAKVGEKLRLLARRFLKIEVQYLTNIRESGSFSKAVIQGVPVTALDESLAQDITEQLF
ncbi:MAG: P-loop NTPase [Fibrobacterota bacterium]